MGQQSEAQFHQRLEYAIAQHENAMRALEKSGSHLKKLRREANREPVANFTFTPGGGMATKQFSFTNTSLDPDGQIVRTTWSVLRGIDQIDGSLIANPVFTLDTAYEHTVTLTVEDNRGATDSKSVTIPAVITPPPSGSVLLSKHDFNDGTLSGLRSWIQPISDMSQVGVSVIDDPTNSNRGKVVQIGYARPTLADPRDHNGGLYARPLLSTGPVKNGDRIYMAGDFLIPKYPYGAPVSPQHDQKKLIYIKFGNTNRRSGALVLVLWGRQDKSGMDLMISNSRSVTGLHYQYGIAAYDYDVWNRLELEFQVNTKGQSDGFIKIWGNGRLAHEVFGHIVFDSTGDPGTDEVTEWGIGNQEQWGDDSVPMRNYRLWDNIEFRTQRP